MAGRDSVHHKLDSQTGKQLKVVHIILNASSVNVIPWSEGLHALQSATRPNQKVKVLYWLQSLVEFVSLHELWTSALTYCLKSETRVSLFMLYQHFDGPWANKYLFKHFQGRANCWSFPVLAAMSPFQRPLAASHTSTAFPLTLQCPNRIPNAPNTDLPRCIELKDSFWMKISLCGCLSHPFTGETPIVSSIVHRLDSMLRFWPPPLKV